MNTWIGTVVGLLSLLAGELRPDETITFFPTWAALDEESGRWRVPVHGWVYEPEQDSLKRKLAIEALEHSLPLELDAAGRALFRQRIRWFLVDNERGKQLSVRFGNTLFPLGVSAANGHFTATVELQPQEVAELVPQPPADPWLSYRAVLAPDDPRHFEGRVQLLAAEGLSVVSDVDDTIKVSNVRQRSELLHNTFVRPFRAVDGMAEVYGRWAALGASFHYVSASPWQLFVPLEEFLAAAGFPRGSFHMKAVRLKDRTVLELLAPPDELKQQAIEPLLAALPGRRYVLVGDSGEHDPEIYGRLARKYPGQVARILIRNVTGEAADSPRWTAAFADLPAQVWQVFSAPEEIELPLDPPPPRPGADP